MTVQTSAGSTLAISAGAPATFDAAGFAALTYTDIGEITNITGAIGRTYTKVEHKPLATKATVKLKGSFDSGNYTADLAIDRDDAGQDLAREARDNYDNYSFKLTEQDGSVVYHAGLVMSFPDAQPGTSDSVRQTTIAIEITANAAGDDIVIVDAA